MTQDHSSKLSFSIEESVWLNKGQEVDEIVSLSLDPEITVEENGEYVLIRGGLKLTGEYRSNGKDEVTDEESLSLSNQVAFRSIEEVTLNEDGTGEIRHNFPIDVTIPQERIHSLDDIYVIVESFDYDLPERGCIQLTADVAITGMSNGRSAQEARGEENNFVSEEVNDEVSDEVNNEFNEEVNEEVNEDLFDESSAEGEDRSFHYEAYNEEKEEEVSVVQYPNGIDRNEQLANVNSEVNDDLSLQNEDEDQNKDEYEHPYEEVSLQNEDEDGNRDEEDDDELVTDKDPEASEEVEELEETEEVEITEQVETKAPSVSFGIIKDRPKQETVSTEDEHQPEEKQEQSFSTLKSLAGERKRQRATEAVEVNEVERPEQELTNVAYVPEEQVETKLEETSEIEETNEVEKTKPPREENALYLTKMLTKGEEEFKKLKMCIIQEEETLNTIAQRYNVNESSLIRVNRLNDSNVEEGQILYIPVTQ